MSGLVVYPCPLGAGRFAELRLPSDLRRADVDRIIAILWTLAPDVDDRIMTHTATRAQSNDGQAKA